jgi:signal transduction histidine kinase
VLVPSAVVIVVGIRSALQDAELSRRRSEDERRTTVIEFRRRFIARLEQARLRDLAESSDSTIADSAIVFAARVQNGHVVTPWSADSATMAFAGRLEVPRFASAILEAQRAARPPVDSIRLRRAFADARKAASGPAERDFISLLASHVAPAGTRQSILTSLARQPLSHRDEFGVPFALYAAGALLDSPRPSKGSPALLDSVVRRATIELIASPALSPAACFQLRSIATHAADSITTARIAARCTELDLADRLSAEVSMLLALDQPAPPNGSATWRYWNVAGWLVAHSSGSAGERLVAVRAADVLRPEGDAIAGWRIVPLRSTESAVPFGDEVANAAVVVPPGLGGGRVLQGSRPWMAIAALLVLIALGTTSAILLWRDVQRDAAVAALRADFVSAVTHELKTPLTAIRMYVETLRDRAELPAVTRSEYLDTILSESERLTRLLDNVLDLARLEQGHRTYVMRPVDLGTVVADAVRSLEHAMRQQGFTVDVQLATAPAWVSADPDAMKQAILNLLANAMKYSPTDRRIAISVGVKHREAHVGIADHGVGIPSTEHARIFEKFYRVASTAEAGTTGAGLGLTIVRHVMDAHHGRVTVASESGNGSVFTLILPVIVPPTPSPDSARATSAAST